MSGLFSILNTANKGLMAQQTALHITGHNITNANTPGYTRQRLDMKADLAYRYIGVGQVGTGVKMDSILRLSNDYLARQIRQENSEYQRFNAKSHVIDELEMIFNEPSSSGLNFYIGKMFDSWKELSMNPELSTSKTLVIEKSIAFTEVANYMLDQIDRLKIETHNKINKGVLDFNSNLDKLDNLNRQIYNIAIKDEVPNDLLDQRDSILKDLSESINFTVYFDKYGRVEIKLKNENDENTKILSFNGEKKKLKYNKGDKQLILVNEGEDLDVKENIKVSSGSIKGYIDSLIDIKSISNELKLNINIISQSINKVHGNNNYEDNIFNIEKNGKIYVNKKLTNNHNLIKAGKNPKESGDGDRALAISKLREIRFELSDNTIINPFNHNHMTYQQSDKGRTIEGMYRDMIAKIGISKQHSDNIVENQEVILDQLTLKRESESGVSIDEEVSNIIKFQKAYEANAKVISVLSEMLDTLINRTGV